MKLIFNNIKKIDMLTKDELRSMILACESESSKLKEKIKNMPTNDKLEGMVTLAEIDRFRAMFVGKLNKRR